ncbi:MAG: family 16 glycoside hydrolase [Bacteroidales bacterium]|nr:family 16 glycoside hydrolase [Bacteroidales bacterium]
MKKIFVISFIIMGSVLGYAQDKRTTETKVADLLAMMPVNNLVDLRIQMEEMTALGPEGRKQIINRIVPPGDGNDTRARFAIESYSRYLSEYGHEIEQYAWEGECIDAVYASGYPLVRSFFLSQLKYIGRERSVEFASGFLTDAGMCEPAVAVIAACESPKKEGILAMSLQIESLPCPASVMNELARMKSYKATTEYIYWYLNGDTGIKSAALNVMAESAHEAVYETLNDAAAEASYGWDERGATAALIQYARNVGDRGDEKTMEKICREMFTRATVPYKTAALEALVHYKGYEAIDYLLSGFVSGEPEYRKAILNLAGDIPGKAATRKWMALVSEVDEARKAEIIEMLGERGDELAVSAIKDALFCPSAQVRNASARSLAKLQGRDSVNELIDYIRSYETADDQLAGYQALLTVLDSNKRDLVARALEGSGNTTKATMLILLASGGENKYFDTMMQYTSSLDPKLRAVAFSELRSLAVPDDQEQLIDLLLNVSDKAEVEEVQVALIVAANQVNNKEERASVLIKAMYGSDQKSKFIPVLALIGGQEALNTVYKEFEKGDAEMRALTYNALANWTDFSSSAVLYDICASGNKNYSEKAFYDYIDKIYKSPVSDGQKLSLLQRITPYAFREDQKATLEERLNSVKESIAAEDNKQEQLTGFVLTEQEIEDGFIALFDGISLANWIGDKDSYVLEDGNIVVRPERGSGGNLFTRDQYSNFILRFEFQLSPGANNGLGIRAPLEGDPAYMGMELQIIDNTAEIYSELQAYQYHGSVYGVIPAKKGFLKAVGEWNEQEVVVDGAAIRVILNGTVILDGDIVEATEHGTMDNQDHPGLKRMSGHIGFLGHGSVVKFRNIRLKEL